MPIMRFSIPARGIPQVTGATWIRAEDRELPHPVSIRLGLGDDGRLVATGVLVEADDELTSRELRIPLARIVAEFADAASKPATHSRLFGELHGIGYRLTGQVPPKIPGLWEDLLPVTSKERLYPACARPARPLGRLLSPGGQGLPASQAPKTAGADPRPHAGATRARRPYIDG